MGYDGAGSIFALGARLTKLDASGAPLVGARNCYTTESLITIGLGQNYSEPDAIELTNGAGRTCVFFQPKAVLLGGTLEEFAFCTPDPYVLEFLTGGDVIASGGTNEVQTVTITGTPTGGTFTLTFQGQTTAPIAYNANATAVQSALVALNNLSTGDVTVTGTGPYVVAFGGAYASMDVPTMTASGAGLTGGTSPSVNVTVTTPGTPGSNATGYRAPAVNTDPLPNGVAVEVWSNAITDNAFDAALPYFHWVMPRAKLRPSDSLKLGAEDPLQPSFEGSLEQNANFGDGPVGDISFPTDRVWQYNRVATIPSLSQGLVDVVADAP